MTDLHRLLKYQLYNTIFLGLLSLVILASHAATITSRRKLSTCQQGHRQVIILTWLLTMLYTYSNILELLWLSVDNMY